MNGEKQYANLKLGKTYKFAGYKWTVCELNEERHTAVIQSHGVTSGTWPGYSMFKFGGNMDSPCEEDIDGQDISSYDGKMEMLYDDIKDVEDKSASYGKGLYLISKEKAGLTKCGELGYGAYWQALKKAAENAFWCRCCSNYAWLGTVDRDINTGAVYVVGDGYVSYSQLGNFVVAPAFNLDLSKVAVADDDEIIKKEQLAPSSFEHNDKSLIVEKNVKKARLILAATEQVSENNFERHYKTIEIEVPESIDLADYDIIGGEWIS